MYRLSPALIATALLTACGSQVEPTSLELGELMLETFRDAQFSNDEEERELQSRLLQLAGELSSLADLDLDDGRAFAPPIITPDYLGGLPEPLSEDGEPTDFEAQTPEGVAFRSDFDFDDHFELIVDPNQNCLGSDSTKWVDRRFTENGACFTDGSCAQATYESSNRTENPLARVWIETFGDLSRTTIEVNDNDVDVVVGRNWIAETFEGDGGNAKWRQRYVLEVWVPDPADASKTLKLYIMWSEASIPAVGDNLYRTRVRQGIEEAFVNVEAFLEGEVCDERNMSRDEF
ncbi:MAG: hypothetical protein EA397_17765 [Deltaproteobacteria bacterium]|nr:MAG: hypothetical protein EA397_17765 [Deltaproteobacteria bacterium]